jgi:hypothetical protein
MSFLLAADPHLNLNSDNHRHASSASPAKRMNRRAHRQRCRTMRSLPRRSLSSARSVACAGACGGGDGGDEVLHRGNGPGDAAKGVDGIIGDEALCARATPRSAASSPAIVEAYAAARIPGLANGSWHDRRGRDGWLLARRGSCRVVSRL